MARKIHYLILLIVLATIIVLVPNPNFGEENNPPTREEHKHLEKNINIKVFTNSPGLTILIDHYYQKGNEETVQYLPNPSAAFGIGIGYKGFGISVTQSIPNTEDRNKYGKTESIDFQLFYFQDKFGAVVLYQKYNGYHLLNPRTYGMEADDPDTIRPDIEASRKGAIVYYSFSDTLSLSAAYRQDKRPEKSSASLILTASAAENKVRADRSLIPITAQPGYADLAEINGMKQRCLAAGPGFAFIYKFLGDFYISSMLALGIGYADKTLYLGELHKNRDGAVLHYDVLFSLGYNGNSFYIGLNAFGSGETSTNLHYTRYKNYLDINLASRTFEGFIGVRF